MSLKVVGRDLQRPAARRQASDAKERGSNPKYLPLTLHRPTRSHHVTRTSQYGCLHDAHPVDHDALPVDHDALLVDHDALPAVGLAV